MLHDCIAICAGDASDSRVANLLDERFSIAEDSLNISLKEITVTGRDGRVSQLDQVYIRGSMIRFFIVPDMLQNAPMYGTHLFPVCENKLTASSLAQVQASWT